MQASPAAVDNWGQLVAAAAGAELVELELEPVDDDFSDEDDELLDSELEPLDDVDELFALLLAESRLSVR